MITRRTLKPSFSLLVLPLATFSALFLLAAPSSVFAQKHWVGPNPDNNWFTAANWNPTGAPALTDDTGIGNDTQATIALPGATTQNLDIGVLRPGTLNVNGTGELTANGNVTVGSFDDGTLNITGGGTVRHPGFDGIISDAGGVMGVATVDGAMSNWLLHNLFVGKFGHGTLNILNGGKVTGFDAFIAQNDNSTGLAVVNGAGGASTLQLGGNFFVGGDATGPHGTGVLRVLNGGIVNSNRLVVLSTGTLEIGANPMITVTNPNGIEYDGGTLKTIADTTLTNNGSLQNGGIILDSNGFTSTLSGVYSGTGGATKIGAGALTLSGNNTFTGQMTVNAGTLIVNSDFALGAGNTLLHDGTLKTLDNTPQEFLVGGFTGGNYTQNFGTIRFQIGGLVSGVNSDEMTTFGTATLSTGNFSSVFIHQVNNFSPMRGDTVRIVATTGGVVGQWDSTPNNTIAPNDFPGLLQPYIIYDPNNVFVEFLLASFNIGGLTPNQKSVARNLDVAANDPATAPLINFLDLEPLGVLPHDYDLIAPEELASIYEIGFSQSVVQNENLMRRMDDIRAGSNGFCANGFTPQVMGKNSYSKESDGKVVLPDKNVAPAFVPCPENRWGVFITGSGDFVNVGDGDDNAPGYDITSGNITLGVDYRVGEHFAVGVDGGYSGSTADLVNDGRVEVDGGKLGAFATAYGKGFFGSKFYVDLAGSGGWNSYETRRTGLEDEAVRGNTDGAEFNALLAYGSDWTFGCFNIGTWSSLQYTKIDIDSFTEHGSLAPLEIQDQDEDSFRATTGIHASYDFKFGHCGIVRPEVRAGWQHEYEDRAYPIDARFASGAGDVFTVRGPTVGRDAALVGAGLNVQWNTRVSTYVHYDGVLGRSNYDNNAVSGGLNFNF